MGQRQAPRGRAQLTEAEQRTERTKVRDQNGVGGSGKATSLMKGRVQASLISLDIVFALPVTISIFSR